MTANPSCRERSPTAPLRMIPRLGSFLNAYLHSIDEDDMIFSSMATSKPYQIHIAKHFISKSKEFLI